MKKITKKTIVLGLALLILLGLAVSSRLNLTSARDTAARQQAELSALSEELEEKQAALQELTQSGDDIQNAVDTTADHLEQKKQDILALQQEIADMQVKIQETEQQIAAMSEEKAYNLEVYHALQEGYQRVCDLLNGN